MKNNGIIFSGIACGALVAAVSSLVSAAFYIGLMVDLRESKGFAEAFFFTGSIAFVVSLLLASVVGLLIGLPMFRLSLRTHRTALHTYFIGGLAMSILVIALAILGHALWGLLLRSDLLFFAGSALMGAPAAATVFWFLVRPDKMNKQ